MGAWIARLMVSIALVTAAASGCSTSAPSRFYTLDSVAPPLATASAHEVIMVGPVSLPAAVDQPQMVVQVAPNRVEVEEFNRWAAPLSDSIARAVAGDLAAQIGTPDVVTAPAANFDPAYQVTIDVQRFESIKGKSAIIEAVWAVRRTADGNTRTGRTIATENVPDDSFEALAAAHSRALARLSADIAAAIRAEAAQEK
jgi:uncharacterized protein